MYSLTTSDDSCILRHGTKFIIVNKVLEQFKSDVKDTLLKLTSEYKSFCVNYGDLGVTHVSFNIHEPSILVNGLRYELSAVIEEGRDDGFDAAMSKELWDKWLERGFAVSVKSEW